MIEAGDTFRHSRTCGRYQPLYYAAASGDFNPVHVDAEVARAAGLPGPILQGMCTLAWLAEACTGFAGDPAALARLATRFSRPVAIGDTLTFEGRCAGVEGGVARLEIAARNQRGEDVLKGAEAEVRVGPGAMPTSTPTPTAAATGTRTADPCLGRRYGPFPYEAALERIRDFALALAGGAPSRVFAVPPEPPPHPWHVDEDAARASPHGGVVAPPTFAAAYAMQPFAGALTDPRNGVDLVRVLHGEQELRWHRAVRAGDRLETTGEIVAADRKGALRILRVASLTVNQRGEPVLEGLWTAVVR
jgi:acyl dehydratase